MYVGEYIFFKYSLILKNFIYYVSTEEFESSLVYTQ